MAKKTNCSKNGVEYFRIHRKINGKYEDFYGKTKSEAEEKFFERKKEAQIGIIQNKDTTINNLLPKWLFSIKIHEIKNTSLESYEGIYRNHIKPYSISNIPIKTISAIILQDYYNQLFKKEKSSSKVLKAHKLLSTFFKYVEKEGYIAKNPCLNATIPKDKNIDVDLIIKKQKLPFNYFREDELDLLRSAFKNNKYKNVVDFALGTGMRQGEIVGLKWNSVNLDKREIYVKNNTTRSADFNDEGKKIGYSTKDGTPKTESSIDIIPMSEPIYNIIKNLSKDSEYVFTANNHQIDKKDLEKNWRNIEKSLIKELAAKGVNFEYRKFHDLRHTFAVLLLLNGTDLYTIMKLLRHKKLSSTEIYLAVLPESKDDSVNKLNYIFQNKSGKKVGK